MISLDITLEHACLNLALEEALLNACEKEKHGPILRFWEPQSYFVVLGHGKKIHKEVNLDACENKNIPVFRRISGGGTVVNGPGCLNYALFLPMKGHDRFENISESNREIIQRNINALKNCAPGELLMQGSSDMVFNGLKFSGNAQKRKKHFMLFHGTILLDFDLDLITKLLPMPAEQPDYRQNRPHADFITNLDMTAELVKTCMIKEWGAKPAKLELPLDEVNHLVETRYTKHEWIYKF